MLSVEREKEKERKKFQVVLSLKISFSSVQDGLFLHSKEAAQSPDVVLLLLLVLCTFSPVACHISVFSPPGQSRSSLRRADFF